MCLQVGEGRIPSPFGRGLGHGPRGRRPVGVRVSLPNAWLQEFLILTFPPQRGKEYQSLSLRGRDTASPRWWRGLRPRAGRQSEAPLEPRPLVAEAGPYL